MAEYPKNIGAQASGDLALRRMFCNFMAAAAFICLARSEDNVEVQLQSYLNMRKHVKDFDAGYEDCISTLDGASRDDIRTKLSTLLVFDFEGAAQATFPPLELEWLITTAFNHGVDLYCNDESELSKKWIVHAFTLAHYHQDGGDLEALLQERYTKLKWDA
ncbi:hypothetical protein DL771_001580 [Monosporascus sp. 5C6A]|nr:hypothetical protein DL771_001580 [Monosporascus sp. 5C6A]